MKIVNFLLLMLSLKASALTWPDTGTVSIGEQQTPGEGRHLQTIGYHFLPHGAKGCLGDTIITDVEECTAAATELGGILRNGNTPVSGQFDSIPCGCSILRVDSAIHFDTDFDNCDSNGDYFPVCKGNTPSESFEFFPNGAYGCPNGVGSINDVNECKEAALALGGVLRDGSNPVSGVFSTVPCGCSIQAKRGDIHFDSDTSNCAQNGSYFPVCKKVAPPLKYQFLPRGTPGCSDDTRITSVSECRTAGLELGGYLRDTASPVVGDWSWVPCGCSLAGGVAGGARADIHFDTDLENCANDGRWTPVCKQSRLAGGGYFFEYNVVNMEFESFNEAELETETVSATNGGRISNCACGSTNEQALDLELVISNSQSITSSRSFTSTSTSSITASIAVTVSASANAIFASTSVSATASLETMQSFERSSTQEESQTIESTSEIKFVQRNSVSAAPQTCLQYSVTSNISKEPVSIPYTADVRLVLFAAGPTGEKGDQVREQETLEAIVGLLVGYDAEVMDGFITYPINGVYTGSYATEQKSEVANCQCSNGGGDCGGASCFSGNNLVSVRGKGDVRMDALEIGDHVRIEGHDTFSRVYGFLHLQREVLTEYLIIGLDAKTPALEISPKHLLFSNGRTVAAGVLKVGDTVDGAHGEPLKIVAIDSVQRRGVFAPATEAGDIVVSGVRASNYVNLLDSSVMEQHSLSHAFMSPVRLYCQMSFGDCEGQTYTEQGYSHWVKHFIWISEALKASPPTFQYGLTILAAPIVVVLTALDGLFSLSANGVVALIAIAAGTLGVMHGRSAIAHEDKTV